MPAVAAMPTAIMPTRSEMRLPKMMRLSRSRPSSSVPNRYPLDGSCSRSRTCTADGSYGAMVGANSATATISRNSPTHNADGGSATIERAASNLDTRKVLRVPNARIEVPVHHVHDEIDHHDAGGDQQYRALDYGVVPLGDRIDHQPTNARPREDLLHNYESTQEATHLQANDGHEGNQRVLQRMA